MKVVLINTDAMVTKLIEATAKKVGLPLISYANIDELDIESITKDCFVFIDEGAMELDDERANTIARICVSCMLYAKTMPNMDFTYLVKKPFLPTEILDMLQAELAKIGQDLRHGDGIGMEDNQRNGASMIDHLGDFDLSQDLDAHSPIPPLPDSIFDVPDLPTLPDINALAEPRNAHNANRPHQAQHDRASSTSLESMPSQLAALDNALDDLLEESAITLDELQESSELASDMTNNATSDDKTTSAEGMMEHSDMNDADMLEQATQMQEIQDQETSTANMQENMMQDVLQEEGMGDFMEEELLNDDVQKANDVQEAKEAQITQEAKEIQESIEPSPIVQNMMLDAQDMAQEQAESPSQLDITNKHLADKQEGYDEIAEALDAEGIEGIEDLIAINNDGKHEALELATPNMQDAYSDVIQEEMAEQEEKSVLPQEEVDLVKHLLNGEESSKIPNTNDIEDTKDAANDPLRALLDDSELEPNSHISTQEAKYIAESSAQEQPTYSTPASSLPPTLSSTTTSVDDYLSLKERDISEALGESHPSLEPHTEPHTEPHQSAPQLSQDSTSINPSNKTQTQVFSELLAHKSAQEIREILHGAQISINISFTDTL